MITPEELKEFRESRGLTLEQLGLRVGYTKSAICKFENGTLKIPERLNKLVLLLNEVEQLKGGE
ncbi:MAG: helix-turn-helix domain-containing protein [Mangrovimonas sp.]|nr:helix-turn-helix domain-containing protein [Mangrovimonas sp.]